MHYDLLERCREARERMEAPAFPLEAIRAAIRCSSQPTPRRRSISAAIIASFSILAVAAAAEVLQQTHVQFTPSGGMVISSNAKMGSRPIHTYAEIQEAARRLDFPAVLPTGLPTGTKPIRLFTAGTSMLAVTYDLAGAQRQSHLLWIFLTNRATMSGPAQRFQGRYKLQAGERMLLRAWHVGKEAVLVVSNGLRDQEFGAIKRAMEHEAAR